MACVGDSITAGYLSSNASFAYPGRLQAQLDSKFGAGKYTVTNFGAGGATVQKGADSPYWNRTQYAAFVNGSYDIVIVMLVDKTKRSDQGLLILNKLNGEMPICQDWCGPRYQNITTNCVSRLTGNERCKG